MAAEPERLFRGNCEISRVLVLAFLLWVEREADSSREPRAVKSLLPWRPCCSWLLLSMVMTVTMPSVWLATVLCSGSATALHRSKKEETQRDREEMRDPETKSGLCTIGQSKQRKEMTKFI